MCRDLAAGDDPADHDLVARTGELSLGVECAAGLSEVLADEQKPRRPAGAEQGEVLLAKDTAGGVARSSAVLVPFPVGDGDEDEDGGKEL